MMQLPKSLTATVHIRFQYAEPETTPVADCPIELVAKLIENVGDLPPELQEVIFKFANYLKKTTTETEQ